MERSKKIRELEKKYGVTIDDKIVGHDRIFIVREKEGYSVRRFVYRKEDVVAVVLSDFTTVLELEAFFGFSSLVDVVFSEKLRRIGYSAFRDCKLENVDIPDSCMEIAPYAFSNNPITTLRIGDGVEIIGDCAFSNCKFQKVRIPASCREIGTYAFYSVPIKELIIEEGVNRILSCAFFKCQIKNIAFPDSCIIIGPWAFAENGIETIEFGKIENIGDCAFGNNKLKELPVIPSSCFCMGLKVFDNW